MLNIANVRKARGWIHAAKHFDMGVWVHLPSDLTPDSYWGANPAGVYLESNERPCGTAACAAGEVYLHAAAEGGITPWENDGYTRFDRYVELTAAEFLGLTRRQADMLFRGAEGFYSGNTLNNVTKDMVLEMLDIIIDTGEFPDEY